MALNGAASSGIGCGQPSEGALPPCPRPARTATDAARPLRPGSTSRLLKRVACAILPVGCLLAACGDRNSDALPPLDPVALRTGAAVYQARCAACHGARGEGAADWTRPGPGGVYPPPPHDSTGHTWHHADGLLYRIVARGTAAAIGDTLRAARYGMPAFDSVLPPREIHAVITYLKTGWTPAQRRSQAAASRADPFPDLVPDSARSR